MAALPRGVRCLEASREDVEVACSGVGGGGPFGFAGAGTASSIQNRLVEELVVPSSSLSGAASDFAFGLKLVASQLASYGYGAEALVT